MGGQHFIVFKEVDWGLKWINVTLDRARCWAYLNTLMTGKYLTCSTNIKLLRSTLLQ